MQILTLDSSIITSTYTSDAIIAYSTSDFITTKIKGSGMVRIRAKACGRHNGFHYNPAIKDYGKHHCTLGRAMDYIQSHAKYFGIPDRTRLVLNESNETAYSSNKITTQDELNEIWNFNWWNVIDSIEDFERAYAEYHPYSIAAKKRKS